MAACSSAVILCSSALMSIWCSTGALLLAWRGRLAAWAWVFWIVSSLAWIVYAIKVWSIPLLTQQAVFAGINILGVYRWLIRKER